MLVYRISRCGYINDLSGTGAAPYPGRWNSKGTYILYTAATPSLALLESVVHISHIPSEGFCMTCLEIPDDKVKEVSTADLPPGWNANPPDDALKAIGDNFIADSEFLSLKIPSAVMPEDFDFLLNPNHPEFKKVKVVYTKSLSIDERLLGKAKSS